MLFEKIHLENDEHMLQVVRRHWFIITSELFSVFLLALLPFVFLVAVAWSPMVAELTGPALSEYFNVVVFGISAWLLLMSMAAIMIWTNYYLDLWIITDRRVIVVEQISFFHRNVSVFRLERLQDIEVRVSGLLATFLNFGLLTAQTAGHFESNFSSKGLPDPRNLQSLIQRAADERIRNLHLTNPALQ